MGESSKKFDANSMKITQGHTLKPNYVGNNASKTEHRTPGS